MLCEKQAGNEIVLNEFVFRINVLSLNVLVDLSSFCTFLQLFL